MKWIKKQRIITICLKGVLAMVILSAMLSLAACRADTGSHINNTGAGAENDGMQDNTSAPDSFGSQEGNGEPESLGSQEGNRERTVPLSRIMTQTNPGKMNQGGF